MTNPAYHATLCDPSDSQLVVVDIQERLAAAMDEKVRTQVVNNTGILIQAATLLEIPVTATEQYPKGLGVTVPELAERLPESATTMEKTCFSGCAASGFEASLTRRQVILAGMESHVCVLQTALELHALGRQVFVVEDAVCARRKPNHKNALARLRQAGVVVSNTESVLFEWLRDAQNEHFKTLSRLIK